MATRDRGKAKSQKSLRLCLAWKIQTKEKYTKRSSVQFPKSGWKTQSSIVQKLCVRRWFLHIDDYQTNKKQRLTRSSKILTTVFHPPLPPERPWVWVSASPWRPWPREGGRHCRIPPETCSGEDTCTGCQEKTLKEKMYSESIRYFELYYQSKLKRHYEPSAIFYWTLKYLTASFWKRHFLSRVKNCYRYSWRCQQIKNRI